MKLLLASESPRRKALLATVVPEFAVEAQAVHELSAQDGFAVRAIPLVNARLKAAAGAARHPDMAVIGADTVVILGERIFGKPHTLAEAAEFLKILSGRVHEVVTGVSIQCAATGLKDEFTAVSKVEFLPLTESVIAQYLDAVPVLDKAGAYGIQEHGELLVKAVQGEIGNVIGLPVEELKAHLKALGLC